MARPREYKPRSMQSVRFPAELHAQLVQAADERDLSINFLVTAAVRDFLERLEPGFKLIADPPSAPLQPGVPTLDLTETAQL